MARKLRIEFAGAIYHVLNRGNYRRDLFLSSGEAKAFVLTLEEATKIFGWRVQAYAVMRNHYHIALQTPQPNLVDGMHWLQSTFATRFNRFHGERGHLFQRRSSQRGPDRANGVRPIFVSCSLIQSPQSLPDG
ncbi:MAG: transposase [Burkholderiales bacterium]|nr:transposase [Opitutaceae bacterium]